MTSSEKQQNLESAKKTRTSPTEPPEIESQHPTVFDASIQDQLQDFSIAELRELLKALSQAYSDVRHSIHKLYDAKVQGQKAKVIRFDDYSKSAWGEINKEHSHLSGSRQYDKAFDVYFDIVHDIQDIAKQAGSIASDETRRNALEGLRKIGKTVWLSAGDTLAHEVQKHFQNGRDMTEAMLDVVNAMSDQQRVFARDSRKPDGTRRFVDTLDELVSLSQQHCRNILLLGSSGKINS